MGKRVFRQWRNLADIINYMIKEKIISDGAHSTCVPLRACDGTNSLHFAVTPTNDAKPNR